MESSDESKEGAIGHDIIGANKRDCRKWKAWTGVLWTQIDPLVVYDADVVAAGMHLVLDDNVRWFYFGITGDVETRFYLQPQNTWSPHMERFHCMWPLSLGTNMGDLERKLIAAGKDPITGAPHKCLNKSAGGERVNPNAQLFSYVCIRWARCPATPEESIE